MSLKSKAAATTTVKETVEEVVAPVETPKKKSGPKKVAETAVAPQKESGALATAPSSVGIWVTTPLAVEAAMDASYGTFPSVVGTQGSHFMKGDDGDVDLGKVIKFQGIHINKSWKVVPGSTDDEAADYFKVSNDGEVCNDGTPLADALEDAIAAGYNKAEVKLYLDIVAILVDCDDEDLIGETVTLQLAPSSQFSWRPIEGRLKMMAARGKLNVQPVWEDEANGSAVVFTCTAKATTYNGNSFTKFVFTL